MDAYTALKLIHILSAAVLFGTGIGTAFAMWMAHRSGDVTAIAVVARNVVRADWLFTAPAVVVQPLTGALLVMELGLAWSEPWIETAAILYLFVGACWLPVVVLQIRMAALAEAAARDGRPLPDAYHAAMRKWFWLGWPAFAGVLAIFWLMVAKPALW